jgi:hypothetical protein
LRIREKINDAGKVWSRTTMPLLLVPSKQSPLRRNSRAAPSTIRLSSSRACTASASGSGGFVLHETRHVDNSATAAWNGLSEQVM